jgi:hypothetical protein
MRQNKKLQWKSKDLSRECQNENCRQRLGAAGNIKEKGGERVMRITNAIQQKLTTKGRSASKANTAAKAYSEDQKGESLPSEMTLHIPCCVTGRTAGGSIWKGKTRTVALSTLGAHLLLPERVDLAGELHILFHIPSALKILFSRDIFHVKARIRPTNAEFHWPAPIGEKVVCVEFNHPLRFTSWAA